jgi:hypothetical protein
MEHAQVALKRSDQMVAIPSAAEMSLVSTLVPDKIFFILREVDLEMITGMSLAAFATPCLLTRS